MASNAPAAFYTSEDGRFRLYHGEAVETLAALGLEQRVALAFADPPYFLSNGGITCQAGRMVKVDKGSWDRLESVEEMHRFNRTWLGAIREVLHPDGSLWVSGTRHVIFSVGFALQHLGFKLLNDITWEKPNPPPNLSCRYFTHSTETLLWAARTAKSRHTFHYQAMREINGGKQMKSVWKLGAPSPGEKRLGHHPTQKPYVLLERIVLASSNPGDLVLDPFVGSGTTGLAAALNGRNFIGIDLDAQYLDLARRRYEELAAGVTTTVPVMKG